MNAGSEKPMYTTGQNIVYLIKGTWAAEKLMFLYFGGYTILAAVTPFIGISHYLSSCRFCDKIAVVDQGALTEYGTHAELSRAGGKYADMWQAQAQYYITS